MTVTPITVEDIVAILRLAQASDCAELTIEVGDFKLAYRRAEVAAKAGQQAVVPAAPESSAVPLVAAPAQPAAAAVDGIAITAPMVGTFYRAPAPGSPPFVEVGATVEEDTVVCIIEVMKVMNPIKARCRGRVSRIAVDDAAGVQFGQLLVTVTPE
ncbi:MAG: acetyl-CoA carboxylase biotin carboxyl carrier protein [Alphaproteobacteria bacterium]|nr:acetyl-CoA carboxylase biotin carboxyl carrier protein [Alphaproteobacteria bacterium]